VEVNSQIHAPATSLPRTELQAVIGEEVAVKIKTPALLEIENCSSSPQLQHHTRNNMLKQSDLTGCSTILHNIEPQE
jgi:hypothetical protein